ncbi:MAG: hypothetical protein HKP30_12875, partial [Myxococcales bacterium]|nr:hypothetical protein [Myxococcales bacterium]
MYNRPMLERLSQTMRDLWLPVLVGLMGSLIALGLWGLLVAERRERLLDASADTAAETREAIELNLDRQLQHLQGLRDMWAAFGLREVDAWRADVDSRVRSVPG